MVAPKVLRLTQHLAQAQFDAIEKLVHPLVQALVLEHQGIANHHASHARVLVGKLQEHGHHASRFLFARFLAFGNLVDQRKHAVLNEVDQTLKHLRLAREVTVQRGLAHLQLGGEGRGGDALGTRLFEHDGQGLQDLHPAFTRLGAFACGGLDVCCGG